MYLQREDREAYTGVYIPLREAREAYTRVIPTQEAWEAYTRVIPTQGGWEPLIPPFYQLLIRNTVPRGLPAPPNLRC